jgi:hypothetical protein
MEPFPITPRQFVWLWLAVVGVTFGGAALLRRAQGLPFFRPKFPDAEVQQNWRSGTSSIGLMGSLARAKNCLWFALTRDTLHVGAHFPFNMFMPRFIAGLDLAIPVAAISSVTEKTATLGGDYVRVEYEVTDATRGVVRTEHVDLWPRRGDHFFNILHEKARVARERRAV